jgi:hypothetical protein
MQKKIEDLSSQVAVNNSQNATKQVPESAEEYHVPVFGSQMNTPSPSPFSTNE